MKYKKAYTNIQKRKRKLPNNISEVSLNRVDIEIALEALAKVETLEFQLNEMRSKLDTIKTAQDIDYSILYKIGTERSNGIRNGIEYCVSVFESCCRVNINIHDYDDNRMAGMEQYAVPVKSFSGILSNGYEYSLIENAKYPCTKTDGYYVIDGNGHAIPFTEPDMYTLFVVYATK